MIRAEGILVAGLLGLAALASLIRTLNGDDLIRLGAVIVAAILVGLGVGAVRGSASALGAAFFVGLFWLWATVALGVQGRFGVLEASAWIAWSISVMVGSVRAWDGRRDDAGEGLHPQG